jgi:DNA-binding transcriptional MerR regulator
MAENQPTPISAARATRLYSIGQVHLALKDQFADLTLSKLRFLEEQGLVTPVRTAAGYRKFSDLDIDRLRIILELQRDKYLPLKVIREYLEDLDNGRNPKVPVGSTPAKPDPRKRFALEEMVAQVGLSVEAIAEAQEVGIMGEAPFTVTDMVVAGALVELRKFGISARHLKGTKAAIDRDLGIIEGIIKPVLAKNDATARSKAADHAQNMSTQFDVIRGALIAAVLSKIDS